VIENLVPDSLWARVAPLLPVRPPRRHRFPGRLPVDDRAALAGIVFVLKTGITWNQLPTELVGCWPSCVLPGCSTSIAAAWTPRTCMRSKGDHVGPSPVNRGHPGSKHHLIVDAHGIPLAVALTGGNRHDITQLLPLLDAVPPIRGLRGRPRRKPRELYPDRGYELDKYRRLLRERGITPRIARRGVAHGSGLGKIRWVVERGFAWLHAFRRLRTRYEHRADIHLGLLQLACALICHRQLVKSF
jgi:transposase